MPKMTTKEGIHLFYNDWGKGQPIVFTHGWPLTADAWDKQMIFFLHQGFRVIAHDRRGHGRSTSTWERNTMDQYADDLSELMEHLDLRDAVLVGHSTGGGVVTRYIGRHGTDRVARVVLVSAVPPQMVRTERNPSGIPKSVFDDIRKNTATNRAQYFRDFSLPFYGYNRPGANISEGIRDFFWLQGMMGGIKSELDSIEAFSETDFTEDLKNFDVPTLIIHGDDDQIVPIANSALRSSKMIRGAELKVYRGAPHGLAETHAEQFNLDLLAFIQAGAETRAAA